MKIPNQEILIISGLYLTKALYKMVNSITNLDSFDVTTTSVVPVDYGNITNCSSASSISSTVCDQAEHIVKLTKLNTELSQTITSLNLTVSCHKAALIDAEAKLQLLRTAVLEIDINKPDLNKLLDALAISFHENVAIEHLAVKPKKIKKPKKTWQETLAEQDVKLNIELKQASYKEALKLIVG